MVAPSLFDQRGLVEITTPEFPGERRIVCRHSLLAEDRARTRRELLAVTQERLQRIALRVEAGRLKDRDKILAAVIRCLSRSKVAKHFSCHVEQGTFSFERIEEQIAAEAALNGIYIVRTQGESRRVLRSTASSWRTSASARATATASSM